LIDETIYGRYVDELQTHLFGDLSFIDIVKSRSNSHRKNRFIVIYLLRSKDVFQHYYKKRYDLRIVDIFDKIIVSLKSRSANPIANYFIIKLGISGLHSKKVLSKFEINELFKDLNSFYAYHNKEMSVSMQIVKQ
jgi:hypothetical protein